MTVMTGTGVLAKLEAESVDKNQDNKTTKENVQKPPPMFGQQMTKEQDAEMMAGMRQ
jgi:hypothetical protein